MHKTLLVNAVYVMEFHETIEGNLHVVMMNKGMAIEQTLDFPLIQSGPEMERAYIESCLVDCIRLLTKNHKR